MIMVVEMGIMIMMMMKVLMLVVVQTAADIKSEPDICLTLF